MLKKVLLAAVATAFVAATALPVQVTPAEAGMKSSCKHAAKVKFAGDRKARHAYKKACKEAHKA
ncbi:MAG TPA: hypothetical protein VGA46_02010 [Methyloceanibacter sp.]|jgi:hypothetical protein